MIPTKNPPNVGGGSTMQRAVKPKASRPSGAPSSRVKRSRGPWKRQRSGARTLATRGAFLRASSAVAVAPNGDLVAVRPEISKFTPIARWAREADEKIRPAGAPLRVNVTRAVERAERAEIVRAERGLAPDVEIAKLLAVPRVDGIPRPWEVDGVDWIERLDVAIDAALVIQPVVTTYPGLDGARATFTVVTHTTSGAKTTRGKAPIFVATTTLAPNNAQRGARGPRVETRVTGSRPPFVSARTKGVEGWREPAFNLRARLAPPAPIRRGLAVLF